LTANRYAVAYDQEEERNLKTKSKPKKRRTPARVQIGRGVARKPMCFRVGPAFMAFMRTRDNQAEFIETLVESSAEFREWQQKNGVATCN
jgi:hypothetical protein